MGCVFSGIAGLAFLVMSQLYVPLPVYWGFAFVYVLTFGVMMPATNALALEPAGHAAGTASSLLSTIPTFGGVLGAYLGTSSLFPNAYAALSFTMAVGGLLSCLLVLVWVRGRHKL